jgi:hypothetical protein
MAWPAAPLVCVLLWSAPALAQGIEIGARAGVNVSSVSLNGDDGDVPFDPTTRAVTGVFATVPLWSWLAVQPEVLYSQKGATLAFEGVESGLLLDYVEVPVLARLSPGALGGGRIYLAAGPSFGFLARAKSRTVFAGSTEEIDILDELERLDIGLVGAIGFRFRSLVVDARYTHGLSDIDKDTSDDVVMKNRTWSLTAGIRF